MKRPAVFLDRDGTMIDDPGYLADPDQVRLLPGVAEAICRIQRMGYLVIVVSNQSGVARGLFDEATLGLVHHRLEALLEAKGAALDDAFYCPYLDGPEAKVEAYRSNSDLRKPKPGMLLKAARKHKIDLAKSWMVGDAARDVEAGRRAGCRTILLRTNGRPIDNEADATHTVASLSDAADLLERAMPPKHEPDSHGDRPDSQPERLESADDDRIVSVLERIHGQLDHLQRRERQQDFSLLRLFGSLLQMFAIVAAAWGLLALLGERQSDVASARLLLACFFQLASLSAFAIDRFR